jgi:hypothetical protein
MGIKREKVQANMDNIFNKIKAENPTICRKRLLSRVI